MQQDQEQVILVDSKDQPLGFMEKLQAHKVGNLHRAISVFIFNNQGHLMIQQRSLEKYHSSLLWANTACSHPYKEESTEVAAHRRLKEEMGFDCVLRKEFYFTYKAKLDNSLTEHEFDHVFVGNYNDVPLPNNQEIASWKWIPLDELREAIREFPEKYAVWLKIILEQHLNELIL
ncbi:isopentenyl-diphosphate Delta-isomerase [Bacteroidetes bacterium endosymbiont of Geopemphigus sp.]|uniref:isopentenyl-diphosphate Delta-isomerase n=1 Tax=Bacteroidetes bacterium endosymbiont of Geopemphigus sp. TaxID=2047937 RepID=UPI000CD29386|nr:isopentenyl-diphosphate Delta-isomerase [Bacteroidetes bacterium endosymbiont of Geopemphigus sp.]